MASPPSDTTPALSKDEKAQVAQLVSEMQVIKDNIAKVAVVLDQLSQATIRLREEASRSEAKFTDIKPYLEAMKLHVESFPHALREARRSDVATQEAVQELSARLKEVELQLAIHAPGSTQTQSG